MTSVLSPFQLLEINLISAQDLAKVSRSMRTYAMAWVHPDRKLTTRVDTQGGTNPTWNDKFVFRVDNQFLQSDTSAIMIEIYALHWFRDVHVGTVRILVGNLIPPQTRSHNQNHIGMRFVALQVRRPSGRPQGILNVGVTVLDNTMRSMPLYTQLSTSAVGYQKLMGQDDFHSHGRPCGGSTAMDSTTIQLRRSKSERSSVLDAKGDSILNNSINKPNNLITNGASDYGSMVAGGGKKGNNKIIYDKPLSIVDGTSDLGLAVQLKAQDAKADSVLSYASSTKRAGKRPNRKTPSSASRSDIGVIPPLLRQNKYNHKGKGAKKAESDIGGMKTSKNNNTNNDSNATTTKGKHNWLPPAAEFNNNKNKQQQKQPQPQPQQEPYYHRGYPITKDFAAGSVWSESEVGPSPSEVAAAIAEDSKYRQYDDGRSSMLDDKWSVDESEGVRTKLERWRTEMPPAYDYSRTSDSSSTIFAPADAKHRRRHTDGGSNGKFSCFGNICGYECSIVCGSNGNESKINKSKKKSGAHKRAAARAPSIDSVSTYF